MNLITKLKRKVHRATTSEVKPKSSYTMSRGKEKLYCFKTFQHTERAYLSYHMAIQHFEIRPRPKSFPLYFANAVKFVHIFVKKNKINYTEFDQRLNVFLKMEIFIFTTNPRTERQNLGILIC